MLVRRESQADVDAIARVHASAFAAEGTGSGEGVAAVPVEVTLVAALRASQAWLPRLSLVAVAGGDVVGHVVCSRARLGARRLPVLGLGPIGVHADHQSQGVGSALMHAVLGAAEARDETLVTLLGEPGYYARFGFVAAAELGIDAPDPSWGAYFQARPLAAPAPDLRGRFTYAPAFDGL